MAYSQSFADELLHLMKDLGKVTPKKMFGALGFYQGPTIFACLMDGDVFYLKAKGALADELLALGGKPFTYSGKSGRSVNMPYVTAPQACLDDAEEMVKWCKRALASAAEDPAPTSKKLVAKKPVRTAKAK